MVLLGDVVEIEFGEIVDIMPPTQSAAEPTVSRVATYRVTAGQWHGKGTGMRLRVGVVGLGNAWQMRHRAALLALSDRFDVRAVCAEVAARAEQVAMEFGACAGGWLSSPDVA